MVTQSHISEVSIPKRVLEALKHDRQFSPFEFLASVSIPKRVLEALKLGSGRGMSRSGLVSIPKRVLEALKPTYSDELGSAANSFNP